MNSLSRSVLEVGKKSDDFWADEVEEVFNDEDTELSSNELRSFKKGRVRPDLPRPYRSPESLRSRFADTKTPFRKLWITSGLRNRKCWILFLTTSRVHRNVEQRKTN